MRVDGFASIDGGPENNWPLSCRRASAVASELVSPSRGGKPGISAGSVEFFANGETERFSASDLVPNRVSAIHAPGMATPSSSEPTVHSWDVSTSGSTAADNCCVLCPKGLGVNSDSPNFKNGIELQANIRDHAAGFSYDVKRTMEHKSHFRRALAGGASGVWTIFVNDAAGTNDDTHNQDECLTPIANGSTHKVRVEDSPGWDSGDVSNSFNALGQFSNFKEFIRIQRADGTTYDDTFIQNWHTKLIVERNTTTGVWSVNTVESSIGVGHISSLDP